MKYTDIISACCGVVFATNGAGDPYIIKPDQKVWFFDCAYREESCEADSLQAFFQR